MVEQGWNPKEPKTMSAMAYEESIKDTFNEYVNKAGFIDYLNIRVIRLLKKNKKLKQKNKKLKKKLAEYKSAILEI